MIRQDPPGSVLRVLDEQGLNHQPPLLSTATDISMLGELQRQWLVVTADQVAVLSDGDAPCVLCRLPLAEVKSFRANGVIGSGFLQARVDGMWVDVLRYSNSLADRFVKVAAKLEELRTEGELVIHPEDDVDPRRCSACGMTLQFPGDICPRCINRGAVLSQVWGLLRPYRGAAAVMCGLLLLGVAVELVPPKLQEYLVDHVLQVDHGGGRAGDLLATLLLIVACLAATRVVLAVVNQFKGRLSSRVGTALTFDLRARMVDKLQQLSVGYYDRHQVGVLMNRVAYDTEVLHSLVQHLTGGFLLQILQLLAVGVMLFTLNASLALLTLIPMPFVLLGSWFFWKYVYPKYHRYWDSASKQAGALTGMLGGIRVVKAFAQEKREHERFKDFSNYLRNSRLSVETSTATFSAVMQLVFSLGGLIVWFVGGRNVLADRMTLGSLMAFLAYLVMFYTPLSTLAQLTTWLTSFMTAGHRIFELLETPVQVRDPQRPAALPQVRGHIRFENVTFGYDRHHPVLRNVSLDIPPGQMAGIVGRSGSGKTTVVNLICRFYDVDEGRVTVDGVDLRDLSRQDLRRQVGVVLQDSFLFRGTIWENLIYGRPNAAPEQVILSAKAANAHDFILRMPFGYDMPLGERGAGLSGGEKQRVSIARALLYDPRILILDEATSSVDAESEKAIQDALGVLTRGRTTIAIAHRLSTLRHADRILVFDRGRLVEEGTHAELWVQEGLYARLVRMQSQLTRAPSVDRLVAEEKPTDGNPRASPPRDCMGSEQFLPRWLTPGSARIHLGNLGALHVTVLGDRIYGGVFAVRAFPATQPERYISLRVADGDGAEEEIGLVRDLADWPEEVQGLLRQALMRRYFIRVIQGIDSIELRFGFLDFQVRTDRGPARFLMRWSHSQAQEYGRSGKILTDVDENRYLIPNVEALSRREQDLFRRHVYW